MPPASNSAKKLTRKMQITNSTGLHARPTREIVRCAMRFKSAITLEANGRSCSAVTIMDIMTADIRTGPESLATAERPDAEYALNPSERRLPDLAANSL